MSFADHKIQTFTNKIISLADQPNMQPDELKAYFDSSPEELRQAHNGLCDALSATTAAADIGFAQTAGVPESTVQEAIENVQSQVTAAIIGSIPSGSIDGDKLAQDVRTRLTNIENLVASEASARATADTSLQNQINTHTTQIAGKCEIVLGSYTGDGEASQTINLGFAPKAVLVLYSGYITSDGSVYGGLATPSLPVKRGGSTTALSVGSNGFTVYYISSSYIFTNRSSYEYTYMAFK